MKKITFLLSTFLLITLALNAAVTFPVDYTKFFATSAINANGNDLETGNATAVNTWFLVGTANVSSPAVSSNNLSYLTYIDNNASKKITISSVISAARTTFYNFTSSATDLATGSYYLSFLMKVATAPVGYVLLTNYTNSTNANNQRGRVQIKDNGTTSGFKLQPLAYNTGGVATPDITYNATHLIVIKYQIVTPSNPAGTANGSASLTIFVDPTPGSSEPAATYTSTQSSVTNFDCLKSLVINQQPGLGAEISGLRFSTSWADVCKAGTAPKLTTPTASAANPVSSTGFTANWNTVANAQSYNLAIYQNGIQVGSTITGISGTSYAVSGLSSFLTYTYTVTAIGDGTNYSNSDASSSASVTTLDPNAISSILTNFNDGSWGSAVSSYTSGSYPSGTINNFTLNKAGLTSGNRYGSKGESHVNSISMDNVSNNGYFTMPTVNSVSQIEIHAATGTAERTFTLKEYNTTTSAWDLVGTYTYNTASKNSGLDSVYVLSVTRSAPSKFRIENAGAGSMSVMQIITRTSPTSILSTPTVNSVTNIIGGGFTANWNTVANATGYRILVTGNGPSGITSKIRYAYTVSGQATNTYNATGTDSISSGRVRVSAIGDDVTYSDSYLSSGTSTFSVLKSQAITFAALAVKNYGDASSTLSATGGGSGNPVVFTSSDSNVATCTGTNGTTLTIVAPGTCTIYANQSAGGIYAAANQVSRSLVVNQATPVITITDLTSFTYNGSPQGPGTATTGGSTGTVSFSYVGVSGTSYSSSSTPPTNAGHYTVTASVSSDVNYVAASSTASPFTIFSTGTVTTPNTRITDLVLSPSSDITVNSNGSLVIDANTTVNSVTVAPGAKLTLFNSKTLTGSLTLQSSVIGTATLVDSCSNPTVSAIVEQYVTAGRNWYLSSPISGADYSVLNKGNYVVDWNEATKTWDNVTNGTLEPGKGYVQIASPAQGTTGNLNFSGTTNSGDISVLLTRTESGISRGFNLVGNPYPSYLDWAKVAAANAEVLPTAWLRTKSASGYVFATVNVAAYLNDNSNPPVITSNSASSTITTNIQPMQAYWVRLNSGIPSSSYTVTNAMRNHADHADNTFKVSGEKSIIQPLLRLQVSNGINSDETVIYFNSKATNGFDIFDSPKMSNFSAIIPEIYTIADDEQLVINGLNSIPYDTELPIGFKTGQSATNFNIKAYQFSDFDAGTQILLHDYQLNTTQDLTSSDYTFVSDEASTSTRFTLTFKAPSVATGINSMEYGKVWISMNSNGQIVINGKPDKETSVSVYNAIGQKILSENMTSSSKTLNMRYPGVYTISVANDSKIFTKKIIVN